MNRSAKPKDCRLYDTVRCPACRGVKGDAPCPRCKGYGTVRVWMKKLRWKP